MAITEIGLAVAGLYAAGGHPLIGLYVAGVAALIVLGVARHIRDVRHPAYRED
jgi:hypothetical protein